MEEKFGKALHASPQQFLVLVQKHQSRSERLVLRSVVWGMTDKTCPKLCDALSQSTAAEVYAFENLLHNVDANESFKTPSPRKKRRRRIVRSEGRRVELGGTETEIHQRKLTILKSLRGFSYLVRLCITHPHKAFSPSDLYPTVQTLHDKLVLFESDSVLQESITALCELWWRECLPGRESLIAQSLPCLLSKSLSMGRKVDVHRIYTMREAFTYFDFMDDSIEDLKHLLIRCVVTPSYLRSEDGRRFVAFLFGLNAQLVKELIAIIRSQIPFGRNSILEAYGEILYRAWRVAKGSSLDEIENTCIQGLIEGAIYASSKTLTSSIRKVLGGFIAQRTQDGVETFLFRLQEPILFRALQVANSNVRRNALLLLVDMFPLEDPDASKEAKETLMEKQFILLEKLLVDDCPDVRSVAVEGACRILRLFWEVVPSAITVKLLSKVVEEMALDMSSSMVRGAVVDGMIYLLDNPQSHELLKVLLPRLAPMLDDPVLSVRIAFADLLLTLKDIRALQFHKVVNLDSLLSSLATDHCLVAQRLTRLLIPSYFPSKVSITEACNRCITLIKRSSSAGARFCEYALSEGVSPKSLIELVKVLITLVMAPSDLDAQGKEGILLAVSKLCSSLGSNQSCKIALHGLFSADKFKCMLSSVSTPSAYTSILQIASSIPPKEISELAKHCGELVMDCSSVLQNTTRHEEVRAAHKLILAWGGFDELMEAFVTLFNVSSTLAGCSNTSNEVKRSKHDRSQKQQRRAKWPMKTSLKWSVLKGKEQSTKSGKQRLEESFTIAAGATWHIENLLAEESTRKALLASAKLGHISSALRFLVQIILQQHSYPSDCLVAPPVRAYMSLITHMALRRFCLRDGIKSSDKNKVTVTSTTASSSQKIGIDDELRELLNWAGSLFVTHDVDKTSEDAPPTVQGKRKRVQGQDHKSSRRKPLLEVSNTTDAVGKRHSGEASRIALVGRISATILKSIVDGHSLGLVTQVPVQAGCLGFASAFIQYMKLHMGKQSTGHDWKYMLMCMKSSSTYAAKLLYLCLKNSDELAAEGFHLANNLLDLIALSESTLGSRFAMPLLAALNPWMADLLIAVSFSVNSLCNDGSLGSAKSKLGFNELAEEGKKFSCAWIVTLANMELLSVNIQNVQEPDTGEIRPLEVYGMQASFKEINEAQAENKAFPASLCFIKTIKELLQKGHARILQSVITILLLQAALSLKTKDYNRTLGLLHFVCEKLFGCEKMHERGPDIVPSEFLPCFIEEINIYIEKTLESLQGDQDEWPKLQFAKGLIQTVLSSYRV